MKIIPGSNDKMSSVIHFLGSLGSSDKIFECLYMLIRR